MDAKNLLIQQILLPHFLIPIQVILPTLANLFFREAVFDLLSQCRCAGKFFKIGDEEFFLVGICFVEVQQIMEVNSSGYRYQT